MSGAGRLLVVWDPRVGVHVDTAARLAQATAGRRDWSVDFVIDSAASVPRHVEAVRPDVLLVAPHASDDIDGEFGVPCVRFDLVERAADRSSALAYHVRGLGLDGLPWALAAAMNATESPRAQRVTYGPHESQFVDFRQPEVPARATALLLHGGFYRSYWQSFLMDDLAIDLARRGWLSANVEFRRPDRHGWVAMQQDLGSAHSEVLKRAAGPVVIFGHSAGGQLALQLGESGRPMPDLCVSLTGVVDLAAAHDRGMGDGAVAAAMGSPRTHPSEYQEASPIAFTGRQCEWLLVETESDSWDLQEMNQRLSLSDALRRPELLMAPGDHFSVIDPSSVVWKATLSRVCRVVGMDFEE